MISHRFGRGFVMRPRYGNYELRISDSSRTPGRVSHQLETDDAAVAFVRATDYYQRYVQGLWNPWDNGKMFIPFTEALAAWRAQPGDLKPKTISDVAWTVEKMSERLPAGAALATITTRDIERFIYRSELAQSTKASYYRKIQQFFSWATRTYALDVDPVKATKRPKTPKLLYDGMSDREREALFRAARADIETLPRRRDLVNRYWALNAFELLAWTGIRPGEAARLVWSDVHLDYLFIRSRGRQMTKTATERPVTIVPQASALLDRLPRFAGNPFVLPRWNGEGSIVVDKLSRKFKRYRLAAALPEHYTLYSLRLIAFLALSVGPRSVVSQPCPEGPGCDGWSPNFRAEGVAGPLQVALTDDGQIYAYGRPMLSSGGPVWNGVLRWNGSDWDPIGNFNERVTGLYAGAGSTIYALGSFSRVGSVSAQRVAVWNGLEWQPLASGFADPPLAFAVAPDGTIRMGGGTRSGGPFRSPVVFRSTEGLKSWDGGDWSYPVHSAPVYIEQIVVAPDGTLYASLNDGVNSGGFCIARLPLNATQFECMGREGGVGSMAVDASGSLYVAGDSGSPDGVPLQLWVDGQPQGSVLEGVREVYGRGGQVWAMTSENDSLRIRHLVGSQWSVVGPPFLGTVNDISASPGRGVIVAGSIRRDGGAPNETLVHLIGSEWKPIRDSTPRLGLRGHVQAIHAMAMGGVLVASEFRDGGRIDSAHVAIFDKSQWQALGRAFDNRVHTLHGDESSGIFVSGLFRHSGDTELNGLARWDGTEWRSMGILPVPANLGAVKAFAMNAEERLVAVGVDNAGMGFVLRWEDPGWTVVTTIEGAITSVLLAADGTMVVGGNFDTPGLKHVAQLAGSELTRRSPQRLIEPKARDSEIVLQLPVRARGVYFLVLDLGKSLQTLPVIVR